MSGRPPKCTCGKCQVCRTRKYRQQNRDKVNEWGRRQRAKPEMKAWLRAYELANRESRNAYKREYAKAHRERARVYDKVKHALKIGTLVKAPCEVCGAEKVDAHHEDYSRPLDVRWLCPQHHKDRHREIRQQTEETAA